MWEAEVDLITEIGDVMMKRDDWNGVATSQEMLVVSRRWKKQRTDLPLASGGNELFEQNNFSPRGLILDF